MEGFRVEILSWSDAQKIAGPIRFQAFFDTDARPGAEIDDKDPEATHIVVYDEAGKAVGTGRLLPDGQIGQIAVVKELRRLGVGAAVLEALVEEARRRGHAEATLTAPLQAGEFYREHGFAAEGKIFPIEGVLHQRMRRALT